MGVDFLALSGFIPAYWEFNLLQFIIGFPEWSNPAGCNLTAARILASTYNSVCNYILSGRLAVEISPVSTAQHHIQTSNTAAFYFSAGNLSVVIAYPASLVSHTVIPLLPFFIPAENDPPELWVLIFHGFIFPWL